MTALRIYRHWLRSQGVFDLDDRDAPHTISALNKSFPETAEVYLFQDPGRTANLRVIFTPSKESPYVFETFAYGYDHVHVFDKRYFTVPSGDLRACCTFGSQLISEVGYMNTSYIADAFKCQDFDDPDRVREMIANDVKRQLILKMEASAANTTQKAWCTIV
jgi:hypothetical protein